MVWAEWPPDVSDALSRMGDMEQEKSEGVRHLQNQRKVDNGKEKGRGYLLPIKCPVFCLWHSLSSLHLFTLFPLNNKCEHGERQRELTLTQSAEVGLSCWQMGERDKPRVARTGLQRCTMLTYITTTYTPSTCPYYHVAGGLSMTGLWMTDWPGPPPLKLHAWVKVEQQYILVLTSSRLLWVRRAENKHTF